MARELARVRRKVMHRSLPRSDQNINSTWPSSPKSPDLVSQECLFRRRQLGAVVLAWE